MKQRGEQINFVALVDRGNIDCFKWGGLKEVYAIHIIRKAEYGIKKKRFIIK